MITLKDVRHEVREEDGQTKIISTVVLCAKSVFDASLLKQYRIDPIATEKARHERQMRDHIYGEVLQSLKLIEILIDDDCSLSAKGEIKRLANALEWRETNGSNRG